MLTLTLDPKGAGGRKVEIIGGANTKTWVVMIDGKDQMADNKGMVTVEPRDSITWKVVERQHGIVFADQDAAEGLIDFDKKACKELKPQPDFNTFGPKPLGTDGFPKDTTLAVGKVKKP